MTLNPGIPFPTNREEPVILVNVPLVQDFFKLAIPSTAMMWAAGLSTVGGVLGLEFLARVHGRVFPR